MFAPWRPQSSLRITGLSDYWQIIHLSWKATQHVQGSWERNSIHQFWHKDGSPNRWILTILYFMITVIKIFAVLQTSPRYLTVRSCRRISVSFCDYKRSHRIIISVSLIRSLNLLEQTKRRFNCPCFLFGIIPQEALLFFRKMWYHEVSFDYHTSVITEVSANWS